MWQQVAPRLVHARGSHSLFDVPIAAALAASTAAAAAAAEGFHSTRFVGSSTISRRKHDALSG